MIDVFHSESRSRYFLNTERILMQNTHFSDNFTQTINFNAIQNMGFTDLFFLKIKTLMRYKTNKKQLTKIPVTTLQEIDS